MVYRQNLPPETIRFANEVARVQTKVDRQVAGLLRRMTSSFAPVAVLVAGAVAAGQREVAEAGLGYSAVRLGEELPGGVAGLSVAPLVGVTGQGVQVAAVFAGARLMTTQQALNLGVRWGVQVAHTAVADTARQSVALGSGVKGARSYVRAVVGETCARCVLLAGRIYRTETAFLRHPRCDCEHVPYKGEAQKEMLFRADEYFESLPEKEQARVFTKAGAEAIRNGADINQVVNARLGMSKAQVYGRDLAVTNVGTTRRGFAAVRMRAEGIPTGTARLLPESIKQIAGDDRDLYLRMLKRFGYIL